MSPQPKWRASAEQLAKMRPATAFIEPPSARDDVCAVIDDLRDARAEIDTLQAAVRELNAMLRRVERTWTKSKDDIFGMFIIDQIDPLLARTDKLLSEDE